MIRRLEPWEVKSTTARTLWCLPCCPVYPQLLLFIRKHCIYSAQPLPSTYYWSTWQSLLRCLPFSPMQSSVRGFPHWSESTLQCKGQRLDPTRLGASKPSSHSYWTQALELVLRDKSSSYMRSPHTTMRRPHSDESSPAFTWDWWSNKDPSTSNNNK